MRRRLAGWLQERPDVRPEPDDEIERDQREHASLEHAVHSVTWIASRRVQRQALPLLPRWQERANQLHGHSPETQHGRPETPKVDFRFGNRSAVPWPA